MNSNKIYIIGGSGSGVGLECAKILAKNNKVIGLYNKTKNKSIKNILFYKLNFENKKEIDNFFKKKEGFLKNFKKIIFINFATYKKDNLLINLNNKEVNKTFNINLFSNFYFSSNLIKNFNNKKLDIIFISSSLGVKVDAGTVLYSSSKIALNSIMKSIVIEYSRFGVKCNTLVLGFFSSPLWDKLSERKKENILNLVPGRKLGNINNIIKTLKFIENNSYLNSSTIYLDGGFGVQKV